MTDVLLCSDAKRQHVELVKDRRMSDQRITKLKDECEKLMISKFGRIVDLEELDTVTVNQQLEEVKDRLSVAEAERAADLRMWNVRSSFIVVTVGSIIYQLSAIHITCMYTVKTPYFRNSFTGTHTQIYNKVIIQDPITLQMHHYGVL